MLSLKKCSVLLNPLCGCSDATYFVLILAWFAFHMDMFMLFQVQTADGNINSEPATEPKKLQTTASKYIQSKHCSTINGHLRLDVKSKTMSTDCCYFKAEIKVYSLEQLKHFFSLVNFGQTFPACTAAGCVCVCVGGTWLLTHAKRLCLNFGELISSWLVVV